MMLRMLSGSLVMAAAALLALTSCPELDLGDVPFQCGDDGTGLENRCPRGYECVEEYCVRYGAEPPDNLNNGDPELDRPVADAGTDQLVHTGQVVVLEGSGTDPADRSLTFSWEQIAGTNVELSNGTVSNPTFQAPPEPDTLIFSLRVMAGEVSSEADTVTIEVVSQSDCDDPGDGCWHVDLSAATGDLAPDGPIHSNESSLTRFLGSRGVEVVAVEGCKWVASSMIVSPNYAELSQTFRIRAEDHGRLLEWIEVTINFMGEGAHACWQSHDLNLNNEVVDLTFIPFGGLPVVASQPVSSIIGTRVRFNFSTHGLRLDSGVLHEMRLSTSLPPISELPDGETCPSIGWLGVDYADQETCGNRENEDIETSLRYCASGGLDCHDPLPERDASFWVEAAPRGRVVLESDEAQELCASTIDGVVEGSILFDLESHDGTGWNVWDLSGSTLDDVRASGARAQKLRLTMNLQPASSLQCLELCYADR